MVDFHRGPLTPTLMLPIVDRLFCGYIFDLDGTIWMTSELVPGAQQTVAALRARGSRVVFLTNNSAGTREMFAEQLCSLGVPANPEDIISTSYVMARYLSEHSPGCACYVIGADPVREELCRAGLNLCDRPGKIDYVVVGIDRDFTYRKLQTAFEAIRAGARFAATNPDPYSPAVGGDLADIGALIAAIEAASQHKLDVLVGKPSPYIVQAALDTIGLPKADCLLVGDQIGTDVLAGKRSGVPVALLLRDSRVREQLAAWNELPEYGLEHLADLIITE